MVLQMFTFLIDVARRKTSDKMQNFIFFISKQSNFLLLKLLLFLENKQITEFWRLYTYATRNFNFSKQTTLMCTPKRLILINGLVGF